MNKRIDNSDKHNLITLGIVTVFVAACVAIFVGTRYVPLKWIAVIMLVCEFGFLLPKICEMYYEMYEQDAGITRFIPGLNVLKIFSPVIAKVTLAVSILTGLAGGCVALPAQYVEKLFGEVFALSFNGRSFIVFFLLLILCNVVLGIGFCDVLHCISTRMYDAFNLTLGGTTWLWRIFLFVPFIRGCGLVFIYQQLNILRMHNYGNIAEYTDEFYEEEDNVIG